MKIGILTYHRSHNYGALLQALALKSVLEKMKHQATFIDYWPDYHKRMYAFFSIYALWKKKGIKTKFFYVKNCLQNFKCRKKRIENFKYFINKYIEPYISSVQDSYDIVIHGSDQIWRKQPELRTYNPVYFGKHGIQTQKKISYAASMGILPEKETDKQILKEYLSYLHSISVREENLSELLHSLGYQNVFHDLDPTLLLPSAFWEKKFKLEQTQEKYALYYCLQNAFDVKDLKKYAQSQGLKLKIISNNAKFKNTEDVYTVSNPAEFLKLMYGASFVFTSSFHGLAFALIFHKPFWASYKKNAGRAESLLHALGLSDLMIPPYSPIPRGSYAINYSIVDDCIQTMREKSLSHLKQMIG